MIYRNITVHMNAGENDGFKTKIKCIKIRHLDCVKLTYLMSNCSLEKHTLRNNQHFYIHYILISFFSFKM